MLADPIVDRACFQGIAPADTALDAVLAWAAGQTVTAGVPSYDDVLITLETTQLDRARTDPERAFTRVAVSPVPLPAGLSMLGVALIGFAGWLHRKRR